MKRYLLSIYILLIGTLLTSCSDFLDVTPEGTPSQNTFFRTDKDATDAIDALYWIMGQETTFGRNLFYEQAGGGDDFIWGRSRGFNTLANFHFTGDESPLRENWEIFNQYIARANWIISSLLKKGTGNLSAIETRSLGEAYFMHRRLIKTVTINAPSLIKYLCPFLWIINGYLHIRKVDRFAQISLS